MFKKLCIRERVIIAVVAVIVVCAAAILILINKVENDILAAAAFNEPMLSQSFFSNTMFSGDALNGFLLKREYVLMDNSIDSVKMLSLMHRLKNNVMIVFGASLALGLLLALVTSRGITRPIMRLVHASKNIASGDDNNEPKAPNCVELQILTESFSKMRESLRDFEDEKSRRESVEITKNLAAGIAHEIKNPINTVGLIADYLQTNLSPDDPEKRYEFYKLSENMKNELKRINRIVEGFLRITKPDIYNFSKENINTIIQYSVSVLEREIIRQGIDVHLQLSPTLPDINADRERLNQVFSNLILNAIEAMPRGGELTITTMQEEEMVKIQFSDTGIGIPEEDTRKIFSPYFTTKKQGFGLGLSLIHDIIQKHRGKIIVESTKGKGTSFTIHLPVYAENE
jgi:signal transduction histidine kinase